MGMSVTISTADPDDAEKILKLQYLCYQSEAELYGDYTIEPLTQTFEALRAELAQGCVLVARLGDEVVGSVRGVVDVDGTARIAKLIVHPRMQRHGLGGRLLHAVEERLSAESEAKRYRLYTGHRSDLNLRLYRKLGYEQVGDAEPVTRRLSLVTMEKDAPTATFAASA
ncbi:GNAT family N-acetyltransferase [Streptomyces sp. SID13666]|uniref:GNAT family N-acetyltransferase n=1 Tax=Streptomyces TaxID=1883 RepID=UPI001105A010|nr:MULTISPECIES: GNAT family N-acetyltransferase [Streptomyces]MCZ4097560.1 GNAT family N-acetyltransferase [Streptomyces sp. H39-C1]NEA58994.1 GNAT family N-acetyltransferase [Streptomyces sp. SID13666]NEA75270.1 GNAT family N-acetyltransferase [Streptomyces sp. SID13588]QNA72458.1 GNAT family N-acetyltransferase [Streptomyces sp. So13.3]